MQSQNFPVLIMAGLALAGCSATTGTRLARDEDSKLLQLAEDIERRGDPAMAASLYRQAAKASPDTVDVHIRLGKAELAAGQPEEAAKSFRTALAASPNDGSALLGLGSAQLEAGQVDGAARTLEAAAAIVKTPAAYNRLGTALVLSGSGRAAEVAFSKAHQLDPANLDTLSNIALAAAVAGQTATAVKTLREVTASPRAEPRHFLNLILVLMLDGQDRAAEATIVPDYPAADRKIFLGEARKVRGVTSPAERARAIGLLSSSA